MPELERVRFYFDPTCPWAWQGARWMGEVERVRDLVVEWRLFSLRLTEDHAADPLLDDRRKGTAALRLLALVDREMGNGAMAGLYRAMGRCQHEEGERLTHSKIHQVLEGERLDPALLDRALADASTAEEVRRQHEEAVAAVHAFGVPTIVLESGRGMFGPAIAEAPTGEDAGEMWDHVRWLIDRDGFYELKRVRDRRPVGASIAYPSGAASTSRGAPIA